MKKRTECKIVKLSSTRKSLKNSPKENEYREQVRAFFYMPDEQPSRFLGQASEIYGDYVYHCLLEGLSICTQCVFGRLANEHVIKSRGERGCIYYSLRGPVFDHLISLSKSSNAVDLAA